MGASQSRVDGNCNSDRPASASDASYRLPLKEGVASPTRDGAYAKDARRLLCTTSSTSLSLDSAPQGSFRSDDIESQDDIMPRDCFAGPLMARIAALVSPSKSKMPALAYNTSFDSTLVNTVSTSAATIQKYIKGAVDAEDAPQLDSSDALDPWQSPTSIRDFPLPSRGDLPKKRLQLQFDSLPPPLTEDPCHHTSDLPRQRFQFEDLRTPCERHPLQHLLDEVSRYEAESDLDAAISSLEEFLRRSAPCACLHSRAASLHKLGVLQWKCGRYFFAEHALLDSIHIYRSLRGGDDRTQMSLELAHACVSLGRVHLSKCELEAAKQCFDECVGHLPSTASPRSGMAPTPTRIFSQACVGVGRVLAYQGKTKAALRRYQRALKTQLGLAASFSIERDGVPVLSVDDATVPLEDVAETLSRLGSLFELRDDTSLALACHQNSLAIYKSVLDPNAVDIGYAYSNFGQLHFRSGRVSEAEEAFETAHKIFLHRLGNDHRNSLGALLSMGQLHASQGQHKKAMATYKRVLRAEPSEHLLASTLHSIALSYEKAFRLDKAIKYYEREVNILNTIAQPCHANRASLLHHMGNIAMQIVDNDGEYVCLEQAADWLEDAAEIFYDNGQTLLHLEASIEETRLRMRRKAEKHLHHT